MKHKKVTNKQIMNAYGQSYRLMQEAKRNDDAKNKKKETMIQAIDLKVGNRFIREIHNQRGLEYDHDFVLTEELMGKLFSPDNGWALQDLFPIPLTPDLLEKCRFDWSIYHQAFHKENFEFDLNECYPKGYSFNTFKKQLLVVPNIHNLHQLQNIYYSLTGSELEIGW